MKWGKFITLEGGEGAGKSTQARLLTEKLRSRGIDVVRTREPGGAPGAEEIRKILVDGEITRWDAVTEALLIFAARRDHLVNTVWPALEEGRWVVCDRFADSTMAYQGYGMGMARKGVRALYRVAVGEFAPDLTLILDLPVEEGLSRADARQDGHQRYERMNAAFHERLRQGFLEIAAEEPRRCVVIDASGDIESTRRSVAEAVLKRLGVNVA